MSVTLTMAASGDREGAIHFPVQEHAAGLPPIRRAEHGVGSANHSRESSAAPTPLLA